MKQYFILLVILSFAIVPFGTTQQQSTDKPIFKVRISVSCDDNHIKHRINSYVKRELRSLGDVEIVEQKEKWTIHITVIGLTVDSGTHLGYAISHIFTHKTPKYIQESDMDSLLKYPNLYKDNKELWTVSPIERYVNSGIQAGRADSLRAICNSLVVAFDVGALELYRQHHKRLEKIKPSSKSDGTKQ